MEQQKSTSQESDPKKTNTEIRNLLNELVKSNSTPPLEKKIIVEKASPEKTPLANLKTMLSTIDMIAKEGEGISQQTQASLPKEDKESFVPPESIESGAVARLDKLIEAHRSKKTV